MRITSLFWGAALVLIGVLLLLGNLGIITVNIWGIFFPAAMILLGIWLVWGRLFQRSVPSEHRVISLEGAARARVKLQHGAGQLSLYAGSAGGELAEGEFGGGLDLRTQHSGDMLDVEMSILRQNIGPWSLSHGALDWKMAFNPNISLEFDLETGASDARLDFTELRVTGVRLQTGASSTEMRLPAGAGITHVEVHSGAASTRIYIPEGVAARIQFKGGLASLDVDASRFPRFGDYYQSPDYDQAVNRADLRLEAGVGAIEVR